eukprot:scaffold31315_cov49-Attheya_sp.AAC.8
MARVMRTPSGPVTTVVLVLADPKADDPKEIDVSVTSPCRCSVPDPDKVKNTTPLLTSCTSYVSPTGIV